MPCPGTCHLGSGDPEYGPWAWQLKVLNKIDDQDCRNNALSRFDPILGPAVNMQWQQLAEGAGVPTAPHFHDEFQQQINQAA